MSVKIETLDDYGFLLSLLGGAVTFITALLTLIVGVSGGSINWFWGGGYIGIANIIAGAIVSMVFGVLAILIGLKLFIKEIREILIKIDLIITSIVLFILGIVVFGIGGLIILVGGILILIYRLMPEGNANPTGQ